MAASPSVILQACEIRGSYVFPTGESPQHLSWKELRQRFAPSKNHEAYAVLQQMREQGFVGLISRAGRTVCFVLNNPQRTGFVGHLLAKDPTFSECVVEMYRVVRIERGGRVTEMDGTMMLEM